MNTRFTLVALSIAIAVSSLALVITVVGTTASSVSGEATGIEAVDGIGEGAGNHLLAYQRPDISQDEPLALTEPISIYLPLLENKYVKYPAERAALMALYNSTESWFLADFGRWGTDSSHCDWYGVTCDENEHVTILDLEQCYLTGTIPSEIGNLPMLTMLRLTGTLNCGKGGCYNSAQLSDPLPPELGNLVNLQELYLSDNLFTTLPPEISNLTSLRVLNVGSNQLTSLPPDIGDLVSLQILYLGYNQLASLPPEIGNLVSLQTLDLSGNPLASLPPEIGNLVSLQTLYLSFIQLPSIPTEIGNLVNLQDLSLIDNQLTSLPPEIGNLASLQQLWLQQNQLSSLPAEIGNLASLQVLGLYNNQLTTLPPQIGNLEYLQELNLNSNQLTSLPPEIGNLVSLGFLGLSYNKLSGSIPAFLSNLGSLSILYLYENPDLTCWETQEARDWALSLYYYDGPTCFFP